MVDPTKAFQTILDVIGEGEKAAEAFPKPKKSFTDVVKGALGMGDKPPPAPPVQLPPPPKPTPQVQTAPPPEYGRGTAKPPEGPSTEDLMKQIETILKDAQPKTTQVPIKEAPPGETK